MIKAEWGTKRSCPKCGTRFYDLGKDSPVVCIECKEHFEAEPVLKSKQPIPFEELPKTDGKAAEKATEIDDDDLSVDVDDQEASADQDVDLGGDDDLGVETKKKENTDDN